MDPKLGRWGSQAENITLYWAINSGRALLPSYVQVSGSGLVPPRIGVQTAALLALHSAAAAAELPLLSCNITSWQLASSADARR